jgi:hypothetical protein
MTMSANKDKKDDPLENFILQQLSNYDVEYVNIDIFVSNPSNVIAWGICYPYTLLFLIK